MIVTPTPNTVLQNRLIIGVFVLVLAFNLWGVSNGWTNPNLYGNEFRQAQTAISAQFIQRENNFSLAYPTPILGKPWSIPLEFPLYQWTVVVISNSCGLSLATAGRLVGTLCFYAGLPALYLLLRRINLQNIYCLIVLSMVLSCPLYIFYVRAFLIETMALMFGLWYLVALVKAMEQRRLSWLILANIAGIGAGLVKVTTFLFFLMPAFAASLWWLKQPHEQRGSSDSRSLFSTLGWLTMAHALPFAATLWWIHFSDAIKLLNPNSVAFTSTHLTAYNFGLGRRFDPVVWTAHWKIISEEIIRPLTLVIGISGLLIFARRWWLHASIGIGLYFLIQTIFPLLYAWHTYYHVGAAFLLVGTVGLGVVGAFESLRLPRIIPFMIWIALLVLQISTYFKAYYPIQHAKGNLGGLVTALKRITLPDETLVIVGNDWSSVIPYYAERRSLMLRGDVSTDKTHLEESFALLKNEDVAALVLVGHERENNLVLKLASEYLGIDSKPAFTCSDRDLDSVVYLNHQLKLDAEPVLQEEKGYFEGVQLVAKSTSTQNPLAGAIIDYDKLVKRHRHLFRLITPQPIRFYSTFGPELRNDEQPGFERYAAHPDTKLWFKLSAGNHHLHTALELLEDAYNGIPPSDASDGVELVAAAVFSDGRREVLLHRYIDPLNNPAERGLLPIDWDFHLPAGAELELSVNAGPKGNSARDWAALSGITIQ